MWTVFSVESTLPRRAMRRLFRSLYWSQAGQSGRGRCLSSGEASCRVSAILLVGHWRIFMCLTSRVWAVFRSSSVLGPLPDIDDLHLNLSWDFLSWDPFIGDLSPILCLQILSVPEICIFAELHLDSEVMSSFFAFLLIITKKRARGNLLSTKFQNSALLFTFNDETPATA